MNIPNTLSILRILLSPFIPLLVLKENYLFSLILISSLALTDFLDGYIARKLKQETKEGKILDPLGDKIFTAFSLFSYTFLSNYTLNPIIFFLLLFRDTLLITGGIILLRKNLIPSPSVYGKLTTFFVSICLVLTATLNVNAIPILQNLLMVLEPLTVLFIVISLFHYLFRYYKYVSGRINL
ncbi:CDP-alcohol phosphatidyltransferase family protein [Aquifex pyrophilus]